MTNIYDYFSIGKTDFSFKLNGKYLLVEFCELFIIESTLKSGFV